MRLVKLDELGLQEAMEASGLGVVEEEDFDAEDFDAEDFELKIFGKEDSKVQVKME